MNAETTALKFVFQRIGSSITATVGAASYTFDYKPSPESQPGERYITAEASVENAESQHDGGLVSDVELIITTYQQTAGTAGSKRVVQQVAEDIRQLLDVNSNVADIDGNQIVGITYQNTATDRQTIGPSTFAISRTFFIIKIYQNGN